MRKTCVHLCVYREIGLTARLLLQRTPLQDGLVGQADHEKAWMESGVTRRGERARTRSVWRPLHVLKIFSVAHCFQFMPSNPNLLGGCLPVSD